MIDSEEYREWESWMNSLIKKETTLVEMGGYFMARMVALDLTREEVSEKYPHAVEALKLQYEATENTREIMNGVAKRVGWGENKVDE